MTGFLLDTNIPSELQRPKPSPELVRWLNEAHDDKLYISVISLAEVIHGIVRLPASRRRNELQSWLDHTLRPWFLERILPVDEAIAERLGAILAIREAQGRPMTFAYGLIAATAMEYRLTLVTRNTKHFTGLSLPLLDPWRRWLV